MTEDDVIAAKSFFERHKLGRVDWENSYKAFVVRMTEEGFFKCECDCHNEPAPTTLKVRTKPKPKKAVANG